MSFIAWKRRFKQDAICIGRKELNLWLNLHNIVYDWNTDKYSLTGKYAYICKQIDNNISVISIRLVLKIKKLLKVYKLDVYSTSDVKNIIYEEYFKIFGNLCKILDYNTRILEYPISRNFFKSINNRKFSIQKITIFAKVRQLWREERASIKINRFFWNNVYNKFITIPETKIKYFHKLYKKFSYSDLSQWASEEYHQNIIKYFTKDKPRNIKQPRLVLLFGLPGSGKNYVLKKRRKKNHVVINMDDCRALLPKYWKTMISEVTGDWIKFFHDECRSITLKIFDFAIKHRMHIVWNGTGKNREKYLNLISIAKQHNYIIELKYIWVPLSIAKKRVKKRQQQIGRHVPESVIITAKEKIPSAFDSLLIETDYARIYENETNSPKMIWDKYQGWDSNYVTQKSQITCHK